MSDFNSAADEFFVNLYLQTTLALPTERESVLHFFEALQKEFNEMTTFYQRETGEFVLEGNREDESYRWLELHHRRLSAGYFNPPSLAEAYRLHTWLLDRSVYFLGLSGMDVEFLDVMFGFNLDFTGNRDAIVGQALLGGSSLGVLLNDSSAKILECQPAMVVALDEQCYLQARLSLETHSSDQQVRTGQYEDEPISVLFTVRRHPQPGAIIRLKDSFARQCGLAEDLVSRIIIPQVIQPIASAIATED